MKKYFEPTVELVVFSVGDVICTSGEKTIQGQGGTGTGIG